MKEDKALQERDAKVKSFMKELLPKTEGINVDNLRKSFVENNHHFSPNSAAFLAIKASEVRLRLDKNVLPISTSTVKHRFQLVNMRQEVQSSIWHQLDQSQKGLIKVCDYLTELGRLDRSFDYEGVIKYYVKVYGFTPKQLGYYIGLFEKHDVTIQVKYFKIRIMRDKDKKQLAEMPKWQVDKIWPALSNYQKDFFEKHHKVEANS